MFVVNDTNSRKGELKMNNEKLKELQKQLAEQKKQEDEEINLNPLSKYSTTQLKRELRRRKL